MRVFGHRLISLVALFSFVAAASPAQTGAKKPIAAQVKTSDNILFVVSRGPSEAFIDPIVMLRRSQLSNLPDAGLDEFSKLESRYFREGKKYRLLFGGGEAGAVVVKKQPAHAPDCLGAQANVELDMNVESQSKIGGLVMGLATDSTKLGRKTVSRRFPTMGERSSVSELAKQFYKKKGISAALVQSMKSVNMTVMDLDGDDRAEIVATFSVKTKAKTEARHFLFVIAEPAMSDYKLSVARYELVSEKNLPAGGSLADVDEYALTEVLVDQIDLDGDNIAEVITGRKSWEGITYRIYKKQKAQWKKIYEVYNYRCAF